MDSVRTNYSTPARVELNAGVTNRPPAPTGTGTSPASSPASVAARVDTSARAVAKPAQQDTRQQLQALLDQVGERIQPESRSLSFQVSEDINGVVVSVIDTETDELVRQIPAETMLRLAKALEQLDASTGNAGFLFTDTA